MGMRRKVEDNGPVTPIHSTRTYPVLRKGAAEFAERLERFRNNGDALLIAGELRWFQETFTSWSPTNRPTEDQRHRIVVDFWEVVGRANNLLDKIEK